MKQQNYLSFQNIEEFLQVLAEVTTSVEPKRVEKLQGFTSVFDDYANKHLLEKNDAQQNNDKLPPILHLVNDKGELKIGNKVLNLSSPGDSYELLGNFFSNVDRYEENGFWFNETKESYRKFCSIFACNNLLHWSGYKTYSFDDPILSKKTGYDVVIQLWKGNCQKFIGSKLYPGGIGAEVGVYYRRKDFFKDYAYDFLWKSEWWPYSTGYDFNIKFSLTFPETGDVFFSTKHENTWWLNKWMEGDSYEKYNKLHTKLPSPDNYILNYEINGVTYKSW